MTERSRDRQPAREISLHDPTPARGPGGRWAVRVARTPRGLPLVVTGIGCLLALLPACAPDEGGTVAAEADTAHAADWWGTVRGRVAAERRAIRVRDGRASAALPALSLAARFDARGVALEDGESTVLSLGLAAWGCEGALRSAQAVAPALGACTDAVGPDGRCIRRLEYAREGLNEWWIGLDHGVEQGWTLPAPPPPHRARARWSSRWERPARGP